MVWKKCGKGGSNTVSRGGSRIWKMFNLRRGFGIPCCDVMYRHEFVQTPYRFWSTILWGDALGCSRSNLGYHVARALCFGSLPCSKGVMSRRTGRMARVSLGLGYRGGDVPNYMRRGRRMQRGDNCCKTTILYRRKTISMAESGGIRSHDSPRRKAETYQYS